jgi:hypothetical protein
MKSLPFTFTQLLGSHGGRRFPSPHRTHNRITGIEVLVSGRHFTLVNIQWH